MKTIQVTRLSTNQTQPADRKNVRISTSLRNGMKLFAAMILVFAFGINQSKAVTNTNSTGGTWSTVANWSQGHVPTSSEDVVLDCGNSNISFTVDVTNAVCNTLSLGATTG